MVSGRCLEGAGRCLKGIWKVSGMCVQSALCLIGVWKVFKMCLEGISNLEQTFIRNTSLAAQGALAHRLQRRPRPIHKNAKSGAHPSWPSLD